jgi:hypothetical protein
VILYHGTTSAAIAGIRAGGIKPRGGSGRNNWKHTIGSSPRSVYLSRCYALHFAVSAIQGDESPAILEIDSDLLDPDALHADEDAIEQANRGRDILPQSWDMKRRTLYYRARAHLFDWQASVQALGTCAYRGTVPSGAILRVAYMTPKAAARFVVGACDPTIALINYQVMGAQHTRFHEWIFGEGEPPTNMVGDPLPLSRDGVCVTNLGVGR